MLSLIASVDWNRVPSGLFVTLTYPDEKAAVGVRESTINRFHFCRRVETYLGKKIAALWRKEPQKRKTGIHKGMFVSHFHLCLFTSEFLPHELVRSWWRKSLGVEGPLATDVRRMDSGEHAAFYLAKYMAKKPGSSSLDNVSYLTNPGRAWGVLRRGLLPMANLTKWWGLDLSQYEEFLALAKGLVPNLKYHDSSGITLLGLLADEFILVGLSEFD